MGGMAEMIALYLVIAGAIAWPPAIAVLLVKLFGRLG